MHTYIFNTTLLALCYSYNISALKGPFSGSMTGTFPQQNQQNMYQM